MASNSIIGNKSISVASLVLFFLSFQTISTLAFGHEITCENLNEDTCAFAVSSMGKRCVLEKTLKRNGLEAYTCRSSEIEAEKVKNMIESDRCVKSCGLDRKSLGISSDALLDHRFTRKLCSVQCFNQCQNVVDLYSSLAAGEGMFLPELCDAQQAGKPRKEKSEIRSSGVAFDDATQAPIGSVDILGMAPEPSEPVTVEPPSSSSPTLSPYYY